MVRQGPTGEQLSEFNVLQMLLALSNGEGNCLGV
jgi:hypothetical protein